MHHSLALSVTGTPLRVWVTAGATFSHSAWTWLTSGVCSMRAYHWVTPWNCSKLRSQTMQLVISKKYCRSAIVSCSPATYGPPLPSHFSSSPIAASISFSAAWSAERKTGLPALTPSQTLRKMILKRAGRKLFWYQDRCWLTTARCVMLSPQNLARQACFSQRQVRMALLSASLKSPSVMKGICPSGFILRYSLVLVSFLPMSMVRLVWGILPMLRRHLTARAGWLATFQQRVKLMRDAIDMMICTVNHSLLSGTTGSCLNMAIMPGTTPSHCLVSVFTSGMSSTRSYQALRVGNWSSVSSQRTKLVVSKKQMRSATVSLLPARKAVLEWSSCFSTSATTFSISSLAAWSSEALMPRLRLSPLQILRKMILKTAGRQVDWQLDRN